MYSCRGTGFILAMWVATACLAAGRLAAEPIFYRMLGSASNGPLLPKTASIYENEKSGGTGSTGMADSGFTEYPACRGVISYTFREAYGYFPRIASHLQAEPDRVNVGDILIDHVYAPDGCVWGPGGKEFVQTFVASGRELVSVTLLVASPFGTFRAALLEGGPGGRRVGPAKSFVSGSSMEWGSARWTAGQAPLVPGGTYALRLWREDGEPWTPYLHSTGNCYDGGMLFIDGRSLPESDLAAWIIEEPADLSRAIVENCDPDGWVHDTDRAVFIPRTRNVRLVSVLARPVKEHCLDMIARVWTTDDPPRLLAGPERNLTCGPENGDRAADFLFAADELPVTPGERYKVRFSFAPFAEGRGPPEATGELRLDLRVRVYGEPAPGALPAIHNLTAGFEGGSTLRLSWVTSFDVPVKIDLWRAGTGDIRTFNTEPGANRLSVPGLPVGEDYDFRLEATGPTGLRWRTPVYRVRTPNGPPGPELYPEHPDAFVPLAPPPAPRPADPPETRNRPAVDIINPDFEAGLEGWEVSRPGVIFATGAEYGIVPPSGRKMAGWSHLAGEQRDQVFADDQIYQRIPTKPGHDYLLLGRVHTSVENGPRGDARVRLLADPRGGTDFGDAHTGQWYWTDGRWLRFHYRWTAEAERSTIGFGFFRWRDLDRASAYVDRVRVLDLGPAAPVPDR